MARSSGQSGSYRDWEAEQRRKQRAREQAAKEKEQRRKAAERERANKEASERDEDAATRTRGVEQRVSDLEGLLRSSLARDPRISLDSLRRRPEVRPMANTTNILESKL
jgi:restriction system protein